MGNSLGMGRKCATACSPIDNTTPATMYADHPTGQRQRTSLQKARPGARFTTATMKASTRRYANNCATTLTNGYLMTSTNGRRGYSQCWATAATATRNTMMETTVRTAIWKTSHPLQGGSSASTGGADKGDSG